jgi:transcriptional regulator with XRE-family HTH domain
MARSLHTAAHRELVSKVVALRKAAGLTQRDLAARLGREQNFVGRIETGQRRIDLVEWVMLCRACGVDPVGEVTRLVAGLAPHVPPRGAPRRPRPARE